MRLANLFELARAAATGKQDLRSYRIGAIGVRRDGTLVSASNGAAERPSPMVHAEARLARKLDVGSLVYVARVRHLDGTFANARPCENCQRLLESRGVSRVYFTVSEKEHGVINFS